MSSNGTSDTPPLPPAKLGLYFKSPSHDPSATRPRIAVDARSQSIKAPRRPKLKPINFSGCAPVSPRRHRPEENVTDGRSSHQDVLISQVKGRMGTLTFADGAFKQEKYQLSGLQDVDILERLGSGMTGEVVCAKHKGTGKEMAAKKMPWLENAEEKKRILMDLDVMAQHKSPYIVLYYGSVIWNNEVWVFMEKMTTCLDRLLKQLSGPIPEEIVCKVAVSVVKALDYLKTEHQVIHRDVKPSNILLDFDGNVKLCDFGISGRLVDSQAFTRGAGCIAYMAPERIDHCRDGYDVRADIWSLGVSLVELVSGALPYDSTKFTTDFQFLTHIVKAPPPLPRPESCSPLFYNFVSQCLTKDVSKRPYYSKLLEHPLIIEYHKREVDVGQWLRGKLVIATV